MPTSPMPTLTIVDAFTDRPFAGNPAAVTILDGERPDEWLQAVAAEMNLAETAFLTPLGDGHYGLRWFTPTTEVPLCGHATLASAHVFWSEGHASVTTLRFRTLAGELRVERRDGLIWLDFPLVAPVPCPEPKGLRAALAGDVSIRAVMTTSPEVESIPNLVVEVDSVSAVTGLIPDQAAVAALPFGGLVVTAAGEGGVDFVSRYFAPAYGIPEDPVTGSTHCTLAPFWAERLGRETLVARQVSRRGGELRLALRGDRVLIGGQAVTVARTELVGAAGEWRGHPDAR